MNMKFSFFTFACIILIVVCMGFLGTFASGPSGSDDRQDNKIPLKFKGVDVKTPGIGEGLNDGTNLWLRNSPYSSASSSWKGRNPKAGEDSLSLPLYTPLQRAIKTSIYFGGNYYQRSNYIQFYADHYDIALVGDYCVDWDIPLTDPAISVSLKTANSNITVLHGGNTYLYNPYDGFSSAYGDVENHESWFVHEADQDGNELPFTFENRLRFASEPPSSSPYFLMNPVNSGYQDFMADFSQYLMDNHPELDGMFFDWACGLRVDLWYYLIPCEAHTTESGSNGDIVIKLDYTPSKIAYQNVTYTMVKVFDNANCQGTDLLAANDGGHIVGENKEIHLNPNDPDCPAVGTQVWVKYAAKGHLPNYAKNNWKAGLNELYHKIKNQIGNKLLIANAGEVFIDRDLYEWLDGFMCENFMSCYGSTSTNYVGETGWLARMNDLTDSESRGKDYMAVSGITYSSNLNCETLIRIRFFCYASFLMGIDKTEQHDTDANFKFLIVYPDNRHEYLPQYYPEWDLSIGTPIESYHQDTNTGLYVREFSNGIVLVNPKLPQYPFTFFCNPSDPNTKVYQLNGTYYNYEGEAVTSVTLVPNSGAVLVRNLGSYVAPDLLEDCQAVPGYRGCNQ